MKKNNANLNILKYINIIIYYCNYILLQNDIIIKKFFFMEKEINLNI